MIKNGSWLADLVDVYRRLGGTANYSEVYILAKKLRVERGSSWTNESKATIRRTVEDHSSDSGNFKNKEDVFYNVDGLGSGNWGLMAEYDTQTSQFPSEIALLAYEEGLEGILREVAYLKKSRDRELVEARKSRDNFTCQACGYRKMVGKHKYIIDVHHLNPIGAISEVTLTSIDDLTCLCPNCHRVAHSRVSFPLTVDEIRTVLKSN